MCVTNPYLSVFIKKQESRSSYKYKQFSSLISLNFQNSLNQQKRGFEEIDGRLNRRLMDVEGEVKELSRRLDRQGRADTDGKITGRVGN